MGENVDFKVGWIAAVCDSWYNKKAASELIISDVRTGMAQLYIMPGRIRGLFYLAPDQFPDYVSDSINQTNEYETNEMDSIYKSP